MRLADGSYINNIARLERTEEIERESQSVDEEIAQMPKPEAAAEEISALDGDEGDAE